MNTQIVTTGRTRGACDYALRTSAHAAALAKGFGPDPAALSEKLAYGEQPEGVTQ